MAELTFIHAADLHLGAPFKGLVSVSDDVGKSLIDAVAHAFMRIVNLCVEQQVDFLVLSGDSFNEGEVPFRIELLFIEQMKQLEAKGIEVFICAGNHDPLPSWEKRMAVLPSNVHIFAAGKPNCFLYKRKGEALCTLVGASYATITEPTNLCAGFRAAYKACGLGKASYSVGVLHTGMQDRRYAPCSLADLRAGGFDYWALGHIHEAASIGKATDAFYAGTPQGLDINESSPHGCYLVKLKKAGDVKVKFVPTAAVAWEQQTIDISAITSPDALLTTLSNCASSLLVKHRIPVCARFILRGDNKIGLFLRDKTQLDDLREEISRRCKTGTMWLWIDAISVKAHAPLNKEALIAENLFPSTLIGEANKLKSHPDIINDVISKAFSKQGIARLEEGIVLDEAIDQACDQCLNLLTGGELL